VCEWQVNLCDFLANTDHIQRFRDVPKALYKLFKYVLYNQ